MPSVVDRINPRSLDIAFLVGFRVCVIISMVTLAACASSASREAQRDKINAEVNASIASAVAATNRAADCVVREAKIVAPQSIDLDTAAYAVLGRCAQEIAADQKAQRALTSWRRPTEELEAERSLREFTKKVLAVLRAEAK